MRRVKLEEQSSRAEGSRGVLSLGQFCSGIALFPWTPAPETKQRDYIIFFWTSEAALSIALQIQLVKDTDMEQGLCLLTLWCVTEEWKTDLGKGILG